MHDNVLHAKENLVSWLTVFVSPKLKCHVWKSDISIRFLRFENVNVFYIVMLYVFFYN